MCSHALQLRIFWQLSTVLEVFVEKYIFFFCKFERKYIEGNFKMFNHKYMYCNLCQNIFLSNLQLVLKNAFDNLLTYKNGQHYVQGTDLFVKCFRLNAQITICPHFNIDHLLSFLSINKSLDFSCFTLPHTHQKTD